MSTSSINDAQRRALIEFFRRELAPLAPRRLLDARVPPTAELAATSYYKRRAWRRLEPRDFELKLGDPRQVAATLDAFWQSTPFEGLGAKLAALSELFPEVHQREDVSAFIYEML